MIGTGGGVDGPDDAPTTPLDADGSFGKAKVLLLSDLGELPASPSPLSSKEDGILVGVVASGGRVGKPSEMNMLTSMGWLGNAMEPTMA